VGKLELELGRLDEALASLERAEDLLDEIGLVPGPQHGALMTHLLTSLANAGRLTEATERAEAALAAARAAPQLPAASMFDYLSNLGYVLLLAKETDRAEALYREAMTLESDVSIEPTTRIALHSNLASVLQYRGEIEESLAQRRQVLALADEIYPPLHVERGRLLNNLANALIDLGRFDEAASHLRQALEIYQQVYTDGRHYRVAIAHNNLGMALLNAESYADAEPHLVQARDLAVELFGREDARSTIMTANLGNVLTRLERHDEAEELLLQVLELQLETLGPDHRSVGKTRYLLSDLRLAQNRPVDALELADEALALFERSEERAANEVIEALRCRARALAALGRDGEAEASFLDALAVSEAAGADAGKALPPLLAAYAEFLVERDSPQAAAVVERAVRAHRETFGDEHPATRRTQALHSRVANTS
jgi:serine/threonine-protein kinase